MPVGEGYPGDTGIGGDPGRWEERAPAAAQQPDEWPDDFQELGELNEALHFELLGTCPPERLQQYAIQATQQRNFGAKTFFQRLLTTIDPEKPIAWYHLAHALLNDGEAEEALSAIKLALQFQLEHSRKNTKHFIRLEIEIEVALGIREPEPQAEEAAEEVPARKWPPRYTGLLEQKIPLAEVDAHCQHGHLSRYVTQASKPQDQGGNAAAAAILCRMLIARDEDNYHNWIRFARIVDELGGADNITEAMDGLEAHVLGRLDEMPPHEAQKIRELAESLGGRIGRRPQYPEVSFDGHRGARGDQRRDYNRRKGRRPRAGEPSGGRSQDSGISTKNWPNFLTTLHHRSATWNVDRRGAADERGRLHRAPRVLRDELADALRSLRSEFEPHIGLLKRAKDQGQARSALRGLERDLGRGVVNRNTLERLRLFTTEVARAQRDR